MIDQKIVLSMEYLEDSILDRYMVVEDTLMKKTHRPLWIRAAAIAACLFLIIAALMPSGYTAKEIASFFPVYDYYGGTNAYTKEYYPGIEYIASSEIPSTLQIPLYAYRDLKKPIDEISFHAFWNSFSGKLADVLDISTLFSPQRKTDGVGNNYLYIHESYSDYFLSAYQRSNTHQINIYVKPSGLQLLHLTEGMVSHICNSSEETIAAALAGTRDILFDIFGVSFPDMKVVYHFNSWEKQGAASVQIYYYDASAHPLNAYMAEPVTDYISVEVNNSHEQNGNAFSAFRISYQMNRGASENIYAHTRHTQLLTLSKAEELLYRGYVFGNHVCARCMAEQDAVDFHGYDYVGFEYLRNYENSDIVPFYVFYQEIGTADNGNAIFAKTYVAAIAVSGYESYFESQKAAHKDSIRQTTAPAS